LFAGEGEIYWRDLPAGQIAFRWRMLERRRALGED
jgi:hypothetical protein